MRLVIAGRGPLEEEVRSYARRDPRIEYAGFLNEKQVGQLLDDSDVLACPSLWEEPFGRVVIDAYKHAMPVIATNMGAFPEIVRDGATGIVVPADQPEKLADALMAYRRDRGMWLKDCENAANEMRRFSMEEHVRSYIEVYRTVSGKE
jgi:glycosyltransferase involved in cell wall biosynthesis